MRADSESVVGGKCNLPIFRHIYPGVSDVTPARISMRSLSTRARLISFLRTPIIKPLSTTRSMASNHGPPPPRPAFDPKPSFKFTQPPNPNWKFGQGLTDEAVGGKDWKEAYQAGYKTFDTTKEEPGAIYKLLISGVTPRPIAFVSSVSPDGVPNLAPFSYFQVVSHDPPLLMVAFSHPPGREKDSCANIRQTKEFTVNIISEPFVEAANFTAVDAPAGENEWTGSGLTPEPSTAVGPPRVQESAFSMECELHKIDDFHSDRNPDHLSTSLVVGRIKLIHLRKDVLTEKNTADAEKLKAISRLGDITYARIGDGFQIPRPSWKDVEGEYRKTA
ncbi:hypothetical protein SISSUDRAFT_1055798 [Sistotremastrum suecicum HHB10207 ss-3]|uniref:Flavin reductase like domain-containing protein n=1 Tax=Sistotremastrum suecicum HHB10207 ss-3 TaxID=1314776 RepID=A0A165XIL1_9AGAM|nr:hypothetical protein SISSUDRAFT_1055798 [Sistotremastrum suecicum HHB10207 ss-3]